MFAKKFHIYSLRDTPLISDIHMLIVFKINYHFNTSLRILIMFKDNIRISITILWFQHQNINMVPKHRFHENICSSISLDT